MELETVLKKATQMNENNEYLNEGNWRELRSDLIELLSVSWEKMDTDNGPHSLENWYHSI